ncbi:transcriptional regulator [Macrococcoides caseolyticum]|nr:transcriptional regulator [Macrococcus caseolyticus]PKE74381.1 transcriptional regulator [Macrococcus caseolyticus]
MRGRNNIMKVIVRNDVRRLMFIKGYNIKDFAEKIGVSTTYFSQILSQKRNPSPAVAKKIAQELESDIETLFHIKEEE